LKKFIFGFLLITMSFFLYSCPSKVVMIYFESNDGSIIKPIETEEGKRILLDEIPIPKNGKEGYTLDGWYTSLDDGITYDEKWSFNYDKVLSDMTLYANYVPNGLEFDEEAGLVIGYSGYLEELIIPSKINGKTVTTIGEDAFLGNDLKNITIPDSVTAIGEDAFYDNDLISITILGVEKRFNEDWVKIGFPVELQPGAINENGFLFNEELNTIIGYIGDDKEIIIPSEINGNPVTIIGYKAFYDNDLTSIVIPASVEEIGDSAFRSGLLSNIEVEDGNSYFKSIDGILFNIDETKLLIYPPAKTNTSYEIPASVEKIGIWAFASSSLETITFESGSQLKIIGYSSFRDTSITSIVIPASVEKIGDWAFYRAGSLETITFKSGSQLKSIGDSAFYYNNLTSITIPDSVTTIGDSAFFGNDLTSIVIPASVEEIGDSAFRSGLLSNIEVEAGNSYFKSIDGILFNIDETKLLIYPPAKTNTSYEIPASVEEIGIWAFASSSLETITFESGSQLKIIGYSSFRDTSITSIFIPASVEEIGIDVFRESSLETITFELGSQLKIIGDGAFYNTSITSIVIPASVEEIGDWPFRESSLETITFELGSRLKIIGGWAFEYTSITSIIIPASVEEIGIHAFQFSSLETITFEAGSQLKIIGDGAFYNTSITSIVIPASVEKIGNSAFQSISLETITFEAGSQLKSIGAWAFRDTSITSIVIPASVEEIGDSAFRSGFLTNIEVEDGNSYYESIDGVLFNKDLTKLLVYPTAKTNTSYEVPASVTAIENYAFYDSSLEIIIFKSGSQLKSIGDYAFRGTSITSIVIPASVTAIGNYAFYDSYLETITFETGSQLKSIGDWVFYNTSITSVVISVSVEEIGNYAFYDSSLETITFKSGSQLKSIGEGAFLYTSITSVVIPASVEEIGSYAFSSVLTLETIFAEALEKPEGWDANWNIDDISVVWGYNQ
jgi:hypothetical protein